MAKEKKEETKKEEKVITETNPEVKPSDVEFVIKDKNQVKKEEYFEDDEDVKEKKVIKDLLPYVAILIIVILIRTFIATPVKVNGPSMEPTLENKQTLILNKLGKYERFSIVVVNSADGNIIKRIVGLPGETVEYKNDKLYINDEATADNFGDGETKDFGPVTLEVDEYFVLGDNRTNSTDSRVLGPIKEKYLKGTTSFRLFPLKSVGRIDN